MSRGSVSEGHCGSIKLTNWHHCDGVFQRREFLDTEEEGDVVATISEISDSSHIHNSEKYMGNIDMFFKLKKESPENNYFSMENRKFYYSEDIDILKIKVDIKLSEMGFYINNIGY